MNSDQLERIVAAAFRGMMQAILELEPSSSPKRSKRKKYDEPEQQQQFFSPTDEIDLVNRLIEANHADAANVPPVFDIEQLLEATRRPDPPDTSPQIQPGPGESETDEWLRLSS